MEKLSLLPRTVACQSELIDLRWTQACRGYGYPWIYPWISICGYQTLAILWIYSWILCCRIC